jgi:hypothetical protein
MHLDKKETPLGLKITHFFTINIFWYLIFSLIYLDFDVKNWWLFNDVIGRAILIFLELTVIRSSFYRK